MSLKDDAISFHILIKELWKIFESQDNAVEKWTQVATQIVEKNDIFVNLMKKLKKEFVADKSASRPPFSRDEPLGKLDYDMTIKDLFAKIDVEKSHLTLIHYLVIVLHNIVYDLASQEGNYFFSLHGQEEMIILKKPIQYYISINKKKEQNILFHAFLLTYALESLFHKHFYVGVDFEYTHRIIKLAQLNFEHKSDLRSFIMIVSPSDLTPIITSHMIKYVMCNSHMKKILMGADSLDYPYMRDEMFQKDPSKIIKFTNSMIDVRYPCEYYKAVHGVDLNYSKCSIYDAVVYFGVISQEKRDQLTLMEETMPVPVDRDWTITHLSISQQKYVQYDVIFLKYYYFRMIYVATNDGTTDKEKKGIIDLYKHVMYELTQFIYLEKSAITLMTLKCKEEVDVMNNYMVRRPHHIYKMQDIFKTVSTGLVTTDPYADIDKLNNVKMFATTIMLVIKKIVYTLISQKYAIHKSKMDTWKEKLSNDFVFDFYEEMGYQYLKRLFMELEKILRERIGKLLK